MYVDRVFFFPSLQFLPKIQQSGCLAGDELFDYGELVEMLDHDNNVTLVYASTKPFWPTSSRDFVVVQVMEFGDQGIARIATKSVQDSRRPDVSGKVRADAGFAGWAFTPTSDGTEVL